MGQGMLVNCGQPEWGPSSKIWICDQCREKQIGGFNYVDVVGDGCEGWLNLFHGTDIVCLVRTVAIADEIRKTTPKQIKIPSSTLKP